MNNILKSIWFHTYNICSSFNHYKTYDIRKICYSRCIKVLFLLNSTTDIKLYPNKINSHWKMLCTKTLMKSHITRPKLDALTFRTHTTACDNDLSLQLKMDFPSKTRILAKHTCPCLKISYAVTSTRFAKFALT